MNGTRAVRSLSIASLLAFSVSTCSLRDDPNGPPVVAGALSVSPVLPPNFSRFAAGLGIDRIHLVIQSQRSTVLFDDIIPFSPFSDSMRLQLPVTLTTTAESLTVQITYEDQVGTDLYTGTQTILARVGAATTPPQIPITYVGPGANAYYVSVSPSDSLVTVGDTAQMIVTVYDTQFVVIPSVYVSWATDDPAVPIDAYGRLPAPGGHSVSIVYATTPNGSTNSTRMYFAPGAIAMTPDTGEVLPGQFISFSTYGPPYGTSTFKVNGIVGGDSTVGTIDPTYGYYNAPLVPPNPNTVQVCAINGSDSSCASITITSPPSPGGDMAGFGDTYIFTDAALAAQPENRTLLTRLIGFSGPGPRGGSGAHTIMFDRGRNAPCLASGLCADSALNTLSTALTGQGFTIQRIDTLYNYKAIPNGVKTIVFFNPSVYLTDRETNELKRFARGGGRIVLVADDTTSLGGSGNNTLNAISDFAGRMGGGFYPYYTDVNCPGSSTLTGPDIRPHQITGGIATVQMLCGTELYPNSNGYVLLATGQGQGVAIVAKVDPTPEIGYGD